MPVYKDEKRGTWYVSFSKKDILTGKFKHVTRRGFKTSKEAKQWERENYDSSRVTSGVTFRDAAKQWEEAYQSSEEVRTKHKEHFEKRFNDFYDRTIQSISKADLILWRSELANSKWSTATKNTTISFVKSVFKFSNEVYGTPDTAKVLKNLKKTNEELLQEMEVWTPDEFNRFLSMVDIHVYKLYFEFLFWTGCRRGEAVALQKDDVSNGWAVIRHSQRTNKEGLKPTKTKQARKIRLDDKLWSHVEKLMEEDGPYLFGGKQGLNPSTIDRYFKKAIKDAKVKQIRIHDLRHSHATWLINNGVNIVAVSKRLGHATIEQTLKTYTHLLESSDQNMMEKINDFRETKHESNPKISPEGIFEKTFPKPYNKADLGQNQSGSMH